VVDREVVVNALLEDSGGCKTPRVSSGFSTLDTLIGEVPVGSWIEFVGDPSVEEVAQQVVISYRDQSPSDASIFLIDLINPVPSAGLTKDRSFALCSNVPEKVFGTWQSIMAVGGEKLVLWVNGLMALDTDNREEALRNFLPCVLGASFQPMVTVFSNWEISGGGRKKSIRALRRYCNYVIEVTGQEPPYSLEYGGCRVPISF